MSMKTQIPQLLTIKYVERLIEDARDAELCRNIELSREILSPVWRNIESEPELEAFEPLVKAQLLRLCGFFLSFYGRSRGIRDYQLRGKNLLTHSIAIFEEQGVTDSAAEANVMLALCYWYAGEIEESELILETVENGFSGNELHPVFLQIRVNRLMIHYWKGDQKKGLEILRELKSPMQFCTDLRLVAMYHIQAGIINRAAGIFDQGIFHLNEAIGAARRGNNLRFVGWSLNNLANLYKDINEFDLAYQSIGESIGLLSELGDYGWIPHVLDTKALIDIAQRNFDSALSVIEESIDRFRPTEDYSGLADSLWTKCRCLLNLNRPDEAFVVYGELQHIAAQKIGEAATTKFAQALSREVYCVRGLPLTDEVAAFKKSIVSRALIDSGGGIVEASKTLGLRSHQALSEILNKQFPELYGELGIARRKRRPNRQAARERQNSERSIADIALIEMPSRYSFTFPTGFQPSAIQTYYCSKRVMAAYGVNDEAVIVVDVNCRADKFAPGLIVLFGVDGELQLETLKRDNLTRLFYVNPTEFDCPMPIDEVQMGVVIGYCLLEALDGSPNAQLMPLELKEEDL